MTRKNGSTPVVGGESNVSILDKYQGKTKLLSKGFLPNWEPDAVGEQILAEYIGSEIVPKGPKIEKEFPAYHFKMLEWTAGVTIKRQDTAVANSEGLHFACSGKVMDTAMLEVKPGDKIVLTFNGFGTKRKGRNAAKLIEVHALG